MQYSDVEILELYELDWSLGVPEDERLVPGANRSRRLASWLLTRLLYGVMGWVPSRALVHFMTSGWTK